MAALLVTSIGSGQLVSKTGRYKWAPILGTAIVAAALILLSTMTAAMPVWLICVYLAIMGLGLGLCMQILVLIVQNTFPNAQVGTATASNNYFRQIGASIGSAVVGSLFATRLTGLLTDRMPAAAHNAAGSSNALTPGAVKELPGAVRDIIIGAYNDALAPVFLYMVPLMIIAVILLCFIKEVPLATTIDREIVPNSLEIDGADSVALNGAIDAELDTVRGEDAAAVSAGTAPRDDS
jgi:MFS family permease